MTTSRTERIGSGTNLPWSSCVFVAKARSHAHTLGLVLLFVPAGPTDCRSVRDIHGREVFGKVMCPRCAKPLPAGRGYR